MGKKSIPGSSSSFGSSGHSFGHSFGGTFILFCIMSIIIVYLLLYRKSEPNVIVIQTPSPSTYPGLGEKEKDKEDTLTNVYVPPLRKSQTSTQEYQQIGILTRNNNQILPLMGKRKNTSRYKWQYYTVVSGVNGNLQTKLPISVKGKSCTGEYGCDEIYNNDTVFVEGYKDIFTATIYENNTYAYII